ncbi:UNVERIFIED_CONTAM: putative E3 ubiquitin-protein ligase HIP1 [Sesamum calycinum]|uniref:RING-type E3 ubiquitin transferase n=1 Tax=Sesamum calycinum TaxID=2727403 RepID=A0AAW2QVU4_9LAMI
MKCNSISDVVSASCSSSESKSAGKNVMKKRSPEGESSLSRRRQMNAASIDGNVFASTSGISISGSRHSSFTPGEDSTPATSVRTRRSTNINNSRMRLSYRPNGRNSSSVRESAFGVSQFPDSEMPINIDGPRSSQQFTATGSSSGSSSYSLSSRNDDDNQSTLMPFTSAELGFSHLMSRDSLPRYNMDGIAEVLLALERIEQDEELTHEQFLALETSLFLGGLNLHDQHRDMRLDIDNMSYEELLALEERMGTVSTALSEEALSKCVRRSMYQTTPSEVRVAGLGEDGDDIKCSICQEEYELADEIGKLVSCQHGYHLTCITSGTAQELVPICKAAASSS